MDTSYHKILQLPHTYISAYVIMNTQSLVQQPVLKLIFINFQIKLK